MKGNVRVAIVCIGIGVMLHFGLKYLEEHRKPVLIDKKPEAVRSYAVVNSGTFVIYLNLPPSIKVDQAGYVLATIAVDNNSYDDVPLPGKLHYKLTGAELSEPIEGDLEITGRPVLGPGERRIEYVPIPFEKTRMKPGGDVRIETELGWKGGKPTPKTVKLTVDAS